FLVLNQVERWASLRGGEADAAIQERQRDSWIASRSARNDAARSKAAEMSIPWNRDGPWGVPGEGIYLRTIRTDRRTAARHNGFHLLQSGGDFFGVLFMALKKFEAGLEQFLEFGIAGRRNERRFQRPIHGLMIGHLIGDIGLVEFRAIEFRQFGAFVLC